METASRRLFLIWKADDDRGQSLPVGCLHLEGDLFVFRYIRGVHAAEKFGFAPLVEFPDLKGRYQSETIFPLFANRLMSPRRADYSRLLRTLQLDHEESKLFQLEVLGRSGGRKATDRFRMFLEPKFSQGTALLRCFVAGQSREQFAHAADNWTALPSGTELQLARDPENKFSNAAVLVLHANRRLGYVPEHYARELVAPGLLQNRAVQCRLLLVNNDTPPQDKVLIEITVAGPFTPRPYSTGDFAFLE